MEGWLSIYAARVVQEEEVQAWSNTSGADGGWVESRRAAMEGVNPRFVLRQWVLEELIAQLEGTGVEGIEEGRAKLARVLDVSGHGRRRENKSLMADGDAPIQALPGRRCHGRGARAREVVWTGQQGYAGVPVQLLELDTRWGRQVAVDLGLSRREQHVATSCPACSVTAQPAQAVFA